MPPDTLADNALLVTKELHKRHGKGVNDDTELMGSLCQIFLMENLRHPPPVTLETFPVVFGHSPGAGLSDPVSQMGSLLLMEN